MNIWQLTQNSDWLNFCTRLKTKQLTPSQQKVVINLGDVPPGATHALIHCRQIDSPFAGIARITFYDEEGIEIKGYDRVIYAEPGEDTLDFTKSNQIDSWFNAELRHHAQKLT
jgi:hypothetical protein